MRLCNNCELPIHPKRLEILPNTIRCVKCSDTQKKGSITVMKGTGDHTWIETIHLEPDEYKKYMEAENRLRKMGNMLYDNQEPPTDIPFGFHEKKIDEENQDA